MIAVQVTYSIKAEFVAQNEQNISIFLADFRKLKNLQFLYNIFRKADGLTYTHISMYASEEVQHQVLNVPSFLQFQKDRDENGLTEKPKIESVELIGSSLGEV